MKTITHTQAQQIIDVACSTWKDKLFEKWGKSIVLRKSIAITEHEYQEMRKACTSEQHQLFDEIFGKNVKFKVGDWIMFEGSFGNAGPYQIKSFTSNGGALDQDGEFRDIQSQYRLATEDELKPKFKIGDWVYAERSDDDDWRDDAKYIPTFQIKEFSPGENYARPVRGITTGIHVDNLRLATEEEIKKAISIPIPKGTPCLVRDGDGDAQPWKFAYSNGNGTFDTSTSNYAWTQVKVLDMKDLPKF